LGEAAQLTILSFSLALSEEESDDGTETANEPLLNIPGAINRLSVCVNQSSDAGSPNPVLVSGFNALLGAAACRVGFCPRTMAIWQRQYQHDNDPYAITLEHGLT
jgi:hypothetical protein